MTIALPPATPELKPLAAVLGLEGLLRLLENRAGTRLSVPMRAEGSILVDELGADVTAALVKAFGGLRPKIPLGREWRVQVYQSRGLSYSEIATRVGLTEDGVWRILRSSGLTRADRAARPASGAQTRKARRTDDTAQYDLIAWIGHDG